MLKSILLYLPKLLIVYIIKFFDETRTARKKINKSIRYIACNKKEKGYEVLSRILRKKFKKLQVDYVDFLKQCIFEICFYDINEDKYEDIKSKIIKETEKMSGDVLSVKQWLLLRYLFVRIGCLSGSMAFRQKAIEKAYGYIESKNYDESSIVTGFKAAIDNEDFKHAKHCLEVIKRYGREDLGTGMEDYFILMSGEQPRNICLHRQKFSLKDVAYEKYIQGKSVAIVGPAPNGCKNGEEIDSYDIIVRIGYKGYIGKEKEFGKRIDVSYYGDGFLKIYLMHDKCEFLQCLDFACFKSDKFKNSINQALIDKGRQFRYNSMFFSGSPTMMQCALYDLIQFAPNKIKLFNLNFNMSKQIHYNGYHKKCTETNRKFKKYHYEYCEIWENKLFTQNITGGFAHHDHLSQLRFTKRLWENKCIDVDESCAKILEMNETKYLDEMEQLHIKPHLLKGKHEIS